MSDLEEAIARVVSMNPLYDNGQAAMCIYHCRDRCSHRYAHSDQCPWECLRRLAEEAGILPAYRDALRIAEAERIEREAAARAAAQAAHDRAEYERLRPMFEGK